MDSLIRTVARALEASDPLGALNWVALRGDATALALRGIALARLGDLVRAKVFMRCAWRAFGTKEAMARARSVVRATVRGRKRTGRADTNTAGTIRLKQAGPPAPDFPPLSRQGPRRRWGIGQPCTKSSSRHSVPLWRTRVT